MTTVRAVEELEALYDSPVPSSIKKEIDRLTDLHRARTRPPDHLLNPIS